MLRINGRDSEVIEIQDHQHLEDYYGASISWFRNPHFGEAMWDIADLSACQRDIDALEIVRKVA